MSLRRVAFVLGEYYHLYNRCNSKLNINFRNVIDVTKEVLVFERRETLVDIGAFCLMPNHFHLLLREKEDGNISLFMKKLLTAYVMYFNKKYERTGSLFEGKFKSEPVREDNYLKYLFSYIHLNPIKL